jgi:thiosulfate dehydrogenase [quinone] large subunit
VNATNPVLILLDGLLVMAWKNAGYIGLDRYLLGFLGTPWKQSPTLAGRVQHCPSGKR